MSDLQCPDCSTDEPGSYMVYPQVWTAAGLRYDDGWFCLPCLEKRLGRPLEFKDFTGVPANAILPFVADHLKVSQLSTEFNDYFLPLLEEHFDNLEERADA